MGSTAVNAAIATLLLSSLAVRSFGIAAEGAVSIDISPIDCALLPSVKTQATFKILNASLSLLPYDVGGIRLIWFSIVNLGHFRSGNNATATPAFWARRIVKTNNGMAVVNRTECRLFRLQTSTNLEIFSPDSLTVSFYYDWTHDDNATGYNIIAPAAYDVYLFGISAGAGAAAAAFQSSLYLSRTDWPQLVAVHQAPQCGTSAVTISFRPDPGKSAQMRYHVGLVYNERFYDSRELVYQPEIFATFTNVTNDTYTIFAAYVASEILPDGCVCGKVMDDEPDCIPCGNRLVSVNYDVSSGLVPRSWNGPISGFFDAINGTTCLIVSFPRASSEFAFDAYNITASYANSTVQLFSVVIRDASDQSSLTYTRCGVENESFMIRVTPIGQCPQYIDTLTRVVHFDRPPHDSPLLTTGDVAGIAVACLLVVGLAALLVVVLQKGWLVRMKKGFGARKSFTYCVSGAENASSRAPDAFSEEGLPSFIGGRSPVVLLLYADDHELHVSIVTALADMLQTFGGCKVIFDKWFESDTVQHNDWLVKQLHSADKIVVVLSDAACMYYEAFTEAQDYPKYSLKFPSSLHISHALSLAKIYPNLRQKLVFTSFPYSGQASVAALTDCFPGQPVYSLFDKMGELVGTLHSAASPVTWSCRQEFDSSAKLRRAKKLVSKMVDKANRHPSYVTEIMGPVADRFDSGVSCSPVTLPWHTGVEPSVGCTDIVTIFDSAICDTANSSSLSWLDSGFSSCPGDDRKQRQKPPLPTVIPAAEALWNSYTYVEPEPSIAGSLTSEQLRVALQRLNSDDLLMGNHGYDSDGSNDSCVTVEGHSWNEPTVSSATRPTASLVTDS